MSEDLAARIRKCADIAGSGDELSRLTAIPRRTLEYYLTGEREPKVARCVDIAKAVGVDIGWLASGEGQIHAKAAEVPADDTYAYIPLYDARVSAGHGAWNDGARVLAQLAFTRYSLRKQGLDPAHLAAFRVDGDSNEPVLSDDDTVMVDLRRNEMRGDAMYVICWGGHLYAKRLQRQFDGAFQVISANPAYPPVLVPKNQLGELEVVGRVVWSGGWM